MTAHLDARVDYRLDARAAASRARLTAALVTAATTGPLVLVLVLLEQLGIAGGPWLVAGGAAIAVLSAARGVLTFRRVARALEALTVSVTGDELMIETSRVRLTVPTGGIAKAMEIPGALGGLRLELAGDGVTERVDIPRGGEGYGDIRAAIEAACPITRRTRRSRMAWLGIMGLVVVAIFFLPFVMEDLVRRSREVAIAVVLGVWIALRVLVAWRR